GFCQSYCCSCCCRNKWVQGLLAVVFITIAVATWLWWNNLVEYGKQQAVMLKEGSHKDALWRESAIPVFYTIRVFNLTNPRQFMAGNNPVVREVGPYVYRMTETKENVKFFDNGTVYFES
ncbi:unnamed protein product, partial [Meganyctiphanes norvegica]